MNLYENFWPLLIAGIILLIVGECVRRNGSSQKGLRLILAGVLVAAAGVGVDYGVKTDYEKIRSLLEACRKGALDNSPGRIEDCLSPQYKDEIHSTRDSMADSIRAMLASYGFGAIRFQSLTIDYFKNTSHAQISMLVLLDSQRTAGGMGGMIFVEFGVDLVRDKNTNWMILSTQIITVNNQRSNWKDIGSF